MRKLWSILLPAVLLLTACSAPNPEKPTDVFQGTQRPEETAQAAIQQQIVLPDTLGALLELAGIDGQILTDTACRQLVTVVTEGTTAKIDLYVLQDGCWSRQEALSCRGYVGKNGATSEKTEGDKATPKGLFPITEAFYIANEPETGLPKFAITEATYWVDDPASSYYNQRVEGLDKKDWSSAERMIDYPAAYQCGFVMGYNPDAIPNAGSAIFFHVGSAPTAGCVATEKAFVLQYLSALDSAQSPYILIQ